MSTTDPDDYTPERPPDDEPTAWRSDVSDLRDLGAKALSAAEAPIREALGSEANETLSIIREGLSTTSRHTASVRDTIEQTLTDDQVPIAGRHRTASEARATAESETSKASDKVLDAIAVLERKLQAAAVPEMPNERREALLRDELRLILDSHADPYSFAHAIAQGPDREAAAVMCSSWGERYLASKGFPDAGSTLRAAAIQGAGQHGSKRQRAAGKALVEAMTQLKRAQAAYRGAADILLSEAKVPALERLTPAPPTGKR